MSEADKTMFWAFMALLIVAFITGVDVGTMVMVFTALMAYLILFATPAIKASRRVTSWEIESTYQYFKNKTKQLSIRFRPCYDDGSKGPWQEAPTAATAVIAEMKEHASKPNYELAV